MVPTEVEEGSGKARLAIEGLGSQIQPQEGLVWSLIEDFVMGSCCICQLCIARTKYLM